MVKYLVKLFQKNLPLEEFNTMNKEKDLIKFVKFILLLS